MAGETTVVSGIAGRYATALFELARDQGRLEAVASDMADLAQAITESADLNRLVRSPVFGRDEQTKAMAAVLESAGADALTVKFVGLVAQNRRLFALADMARDFRRLLAAHRGEVAASVTSAYELSDAELSAIKSELSAAMKTDVDVERVVDPAILGGLVVKVGSRMVDSSLRTKLQGLRLAMKGAE
ncbi:MAG: F0F1 ATP synthase subunit delta [Alphaproteobacteria bacterium]